MIIDYKEKLKAIINSNKTPFVDIDTFLKYFPELKESEDEKIRKELINYFKENNAALAFKGISNECVIAWLEKQGDKTAWSEDDENRINRLIAYFEDKESFTAEDDVVYANWLKSLKDRYTWKPSEEQMENLSRAFNSGTFRTSLLRDLYQDLKKLREE